MHSSAYSVITLYNVLDPSTPISQFLHGQILDLKFFIRQGEKYISGIPGNKETDFFKSSIFVFVYVTPAVCEDW